MTTHVTSPRVSSARPELTYAIMGETGLDEDVMRRLVQTFYARIRRDAVLGPIFESTVTDWRSHIERMVDFWSSVALMTGRYHGRPVEAHTPLPIDASHFDRWLGLFRKTAEDICTPSGAAHVIERAERIAHSLHASVIRVQHTPGSRQSFRE